MNRATLYPLRWVLTPTAALVGFAAVYAVTTRVSGLLHTRASEQQIESVLPLDVRIACIGAAAAFAFVLSGSGMAPSARRACAAVLFGIGSGAAWFLLRAWLFPEWHPRAYQLSLLPWIGTEVGGLLGVACVVWWFAPPHSRTTALA